MTRVLDHDRARRGPRPPASRAGHFLALAAGVTAVLGGLVLVMAQPVVLDAPAAVAMWAGFAAIALGGIAAANAALDLAEVS